MSDKMVTHWNSAGVANGYSSKYVGLFITPVISLIIFVFLVFLPKLDPLNKNFKNFKKYFDIFIVIILLFLFYINILIILNNFGYLINVSEYLIPALFFLFYYLGIMIKKSEPNWFVGIRTPWTISNKTVWKKTSKLGSLLFKTSAFIMLLGLFIKEYFIYFVIVPIMISVVIIYIYSYVVYKSQIKQGIL
jgi:uncharacterized membrane protein